MDYTFRSPTKGSLSGTEFLDELVEYVNSQPHQSYLITVGTDSRELAERSSFVSVVAIHRVGHGGRYFWRRFYREKFAALRRRIYIETTKSLELASQLHTGLGQALHRLPDSFDFDFEIHVDIGKNGPTSEMINEIVGMVRGYGYQVRTKPQAYCAAVVADKYA